MMFENFDPVGNSPSPENTRFFPVSSLEEVAVHLRDNDEEGRYEHYLVQIKHPLAKAGAIDGPKAVLPPPFPTVKAKSQVPTPEVETVAKPRDEAPAPSFKAEKTTFLISPRMRICFLRPARSILPGTSIGQS